MQLEVKYGSTTRHVAASMAALAALALIAAIALCSPVHLAQAYADHGSQLPAEMRSFSQVAKASSSAHDAAENEPALDSQASDAPASDGQRADSAVSADPVGGATTVTASAATTSLAAASAPGRPKVSLSAARAGTVTVKASGLSNVAGYEFRLARDGKFKQSAKSKLTNRARHCFCASVTPKRWYAQARAYRLVDGVKKWGPWSSTASVTTKRLTVAVVGSTSSGAGGWLGRNGCKMVRLSSTAFDVAKFDGLVIPGGADVTPSLYGAKRHARTYGCNIKFDRLQIAVIRKFVNAGKPVLGICRGNQIVNVALGGTLFQHIPGWHKRYRTVKISEGSWLYDAFGPTESVSHSHHQCVLKLGKGLVATQWDKKDGRIEAFEHETLPVFGLQWHPEGMGKRGRTVARMFMKVCAATNRAAA